MSLQEQSTQQLQHQTATFRSRAQDPYPWEDPKELLYQAGIRQEILTSRGVR